MLRRRASTATKPAIVESEYKDFIRLSGRQHPVVWCPVSGANCSRGAMHLDHKTCVWVIAEEIAARPRYYSRGDSRSRGQQLRFVFVVEFYWQDVLGA